MTIHLNLNQVRQYAKNLISERGEDYVSKLPNGKSGCYNIACFTADGEFIPSHKAESPEAAEKYGVELAEIKPQCLIGSIIIAAGIKPEDILKGGKADTNVTGMLNWRKDDGMHHIVATEAAKRWMSVAQRAQDRGKTWGEAFKVADKFTMDHVASENSIL